MCLVEVGIHRRAEGQSERLSTVAAVVVAAEAAADELISSAIFDATLRDGLNFDHLRCTILMRLKCFQILFGEEDSTFRQLKDSET